MIDMRREDELKLGESQFSQLKNQFRGHVLSQASPPSRRVERIGRRIARVSEQDDYDWEFVVFERAEPNAFCLPGGKIGVFTGMLDLADTDDELAAVLAHEVGHAVARHSAEQVSRMFLLIPVRLLMAFILDTYVLNDILVNLFILLPSSRRNEMEADYIGLRLMTKACYDPHGSPAIFTKLGEYAKRNPMKIPEYLSTHPADDRRITTLEGLLPEVLEEYETQCSPSVRRFSRMSAFSL
mmetsp:Transcript_30780/g.117799  ORF Transcript_30780/g.117799 Transcript_30780/m.117799 type:complete len:240 (+) Transcript_30780:172-891(+)